MKIPNMFGRETDMTTIVGWPSLVGKVVEVWSMGSLHRTGLVEDAMPDGSGLWIAADGSMPRQYIDASEFEVFELGCP